MRTISKEELKEMLNKHQMYLDDNETGEKADLRGANLRSTNLRSASLRYADLRYADLSRADLGFTKGVQVFSFNQHRAIATTNFSFIQIGCEKHTTTHWIKHFKEIGEASGYSEEEIEAYGIFIDMINKRK